MFMLSIHSIQHVVRVMLHVCIFKNNNKKISKKVVVCMYATQLQHELVRHHNECTHNPETGA